MYTGVGAKLEAKHLVLELADRSGLVVTQRICSLLHSAYHRWGAANKDLDISGGWR